MSNYFTMSSQLPLSSTQKNVGRIMGNEAEVLRVLREGNMMNLKVGWARVAVSLHLPKSSSPIVQLCSHPQVLDTATLSFGEQLKALRNSNVIVGIHGAGLMYIMFAADEVSAMTVCCRVNGSDERLNILFHFLHYRLIQLIYTSYFSRFMMRAIYRFVLQTVSYPTFLLETYIGALIHSITKVFVDLSKR